MNPGQEGCGRGCSECHGCLNKGCEIQPGVGEDSSPPLRLYEILDVQSLISFPTTSQPSPISGALLSLVSEPLVVVFG